MLRNKWTHNTKQPAPETRHAARRTPNRCRKSLRRPSIQHSVEHGLEKVLHSIQTDIGRGTVDRAKDEDADRHEQRGDDHGVFAPDIGCTVEKGAKEDADGTGQVDEDVGAICVVERQVEGAVFERDDTRKIGASDGEAGEVADIGEPDESGQADHLG